MISNKIVETTHFQIRQIDSWKLKADSWIEQDMKSNQFAWNRYRLNGWLSGIWNEDNEVSTTNGIKLLLKNGLRTSPLVFARLVELKIKFRLNIEH